MKKFLLLLLVSANVFADSQIQQQVVPDSAYSRSNSYQDLIIKRCWDAYYTRLFKIEALRNRNSRQEIEFLEKDALIVSENCRRLEAENRNRILNEQRTMQIFKK